ncbi:MAG: nucleotidyl transferase AbiEii/AbiGii toxin family protein [Clostridia bacterium]
MIKIASEKSQDWRALFHNTAMKKGLSDAIVEKDFWVCWTLYYLFESSLWRHGLAFKGGTSLSKCYGIIKRFSEDIDLILDWRILGYCTNEMWGARSNTQQERYCKEINGRTADFLANEFLPTLTRDFGKLLPHPFGLSIDACDPQTVCFDYPKCFQTEYVLGTIRLEIGALAAWTPAQTRRITPYCAECYGALFEQPSAQVLTVSAARTFWEKVTILHKEAFRTNGKLPPRYSRHYYDLYCMDKLTVKGAAYADLELLERVVAFKARFYHSNAARYDLAHPGTMRLMPPQDCLIGLAADYEQMQDMLFGDKPSFGKVIETIARMEGEINRLK